MAPPRLSPRPRLPPPSLDDTNNAAVVTEAAARAAESGVGAGRGRGSWTPRISAPIERSPRTRRWLRPRRRLPLSSSSASAGASASSQEGSGSDAPEEQLSEGWLYGGLEWPKRGDQMMGGFSASGGRGAFVRCRRWVRPRERFHVSEAQLRELRRGVRRGTATTARTTTTTMTETSTNNSNDTAANGSGEEDLSGPPPVEVLAAAEEEDQRMIAEFDAIASAKPDATALAYLSSSSLSSSSSSSSSMGSVLRRHSLPIGGAVGGAGDGSGDGVALAAPR